MRKLLLKGTIGFIATFLLLTSCNKYEDGPGVSLKARKSRVANTWIIDKAYNDGDDITSKYDQYELYLSTDGDATIVANYSFGDLNFEFETDGTWSFLSNDEELELDFENNSADRVYQILRLKSNELWLREKGEDLEIQLKSK